MSNIQTPRTRLVIGLAEQIAESLKSSFVGTEHLLLAILQHGEGAAATVLKRFGITYDVARAAITEIYKEKK